MLSSGPEVQYVALRNILLIVQRRPAVLKNDVKVFFCKYNDPIYVKLAKLEIMYRLARDENYNEVLAELQEYVFAYSFLPLELYVNPVNKVCVRGGYRFRPQSGTVNRAPCNQGRERCRPMYRNAPVSHRHQSDLCRARSDHRH